MKVFLIGPIPPPYTGQSVSFQKLLDSVREDPDISETYHFNTTPRSADHITGVLSFYRIFETLLLIQSFALKLFRFKPDVIYLTKGSTKSGFLRDLALLVLKMVLLPSAKFIIHLKGGNYDVFYNSCGPLLKVLVRFFLNKAHRIIVLGPSLIGMYDFLPNVAVKIVVVENALTTGAPTHEAIDNTEPCQASSEVEKWHVNITYLSNLIYSKGFLDLLDAAKMLRERSVSCFDVHFAGEFMASPDDPATISHDQMKEQFFSRISDKSDARFMTYHGVVFGEKKTALLEATDIFVLPTNYHVEGQPVSIIEAMAFGCAIITTNYRSIPDIVTAGSNAFFVNYGDPGSIASALEKLLLNPERLKAFKNYSRRTYKERFTWPVHYKKIKSVFFDQPGN